MLVACFLTLWPVLETSSPLYKYVLASYNTINPVKRNSRCLLVYGTMHICLTKLNTSAHISVNGHVNVGLNSNVHVSLNIKNN